MKAKYQLVFNRRKVLNSRGEAPIEFRIFLNGKKIYVSSKIYIKPNQWNENRLKVNSKHPNNIKINNFLYEKLSELEEYELNQINKGKRINIDDIKRHLKSKEKDNNNFILWCFKVLEEDKIITESTRKKKKVLINRLKKFNNNLQFSQIDYTFMREFDNFLHTEKTSEGKDLKQVTIHGQMKILRYFLNLAYREQKISFVPDYKVKKGEIPKEALSQSELKQIEDADFSDIPSLQKTKDLFLFSSYTALRFSDIAKLTEDSIRETENGIELHILMQKVKRIINIPLYKLFEGKPQIILERYRKNKNKTIFEVPTNQFVNRNLKAIKIATGIKKPLTFHISRHTCLTLIGKKTGNPYLVMKIAGHSDIKTSMKYTQGVVDNELFNLL